MAGLSHDLVAGESILAYRHGHQIRLERVKGHLAGRAAAVYLAIAVVTASALTYRVIHQALPMEPSAQGEEYLIVAEGHRDGVKILAIVEQRLLDELPVFELLGRFGSGHDVEETGIPNCGHIDISDDRVIGGQIGDQLGRRRAARP